MKLEDKYDFQFVTTKDTVAEFAANKKIFEILVREVEDLSERKLNATLSDGKTRIINSVLEKLIGVLEGQPEVKHLRLLDVERLPEARDVTLVVGHYQSALDAFQRRHIQEVNGKKEWFTKELIEELRARPKTKLSDSSQL